MQQLPYPSVARRLIISLVVGLLALLAAAAPAAAAGPADWLEAERATDWAEVPPREPAPIATPAPTPTPTPTPAPTATASPRVTPTPADEGIGYDISYPQCGEPYPESAAFSIVGVNGGRVFSRNPCLGTADGPSQLEWAGEDAELYFNTGNPGPRLSRFWPSGQAEPRECDTRDRRGDDTLDCAYAYGWNAAEYAYRNALRAYIDLEWADPDADRLPGTPTIWLDVEPANSWRDDRGLNIAALEGAVAYLESMEVGRIGFYSTPRLWNRITGGTDRFAEYPAWHAGARDRADAERRCADRAFTGGELAMVQWIQGGFDANLRCDSSA